jgi:hypothetical protein
MTIATLAGHRVIEADAWIPAWGCWYAEATLDEEATLSGSVTLQIADLKLVGTILSGGPSKGRSHYRIVAGAGGWGKKVRRLAYANDFGVKVATVIADAAKDAGETVVVTSSDRLGPAWTRAEDVAARVLEQVAPAAWYVGEDGVTRLGARPASTLSGAVTHGPVDHARGTVTLASDSIVRIVPGLVVDGLTVVDVHHKLAAKGALRSTVWGAAGGSSRRLTAWRRLFDQLDPNRRFRGVTEYRVVLAEGKRWDLQPVRVSSGMPDLLRVPVRPGVAGCEADLALGALVLVGFVNSDPARPYVAAFEDADGGGFLPTTLTIAQGSKGVARTDDAIELTSITATAGGDPVVLTSATGKITGGSSRVRCG